MLLAPCVSSPRVLHARQCKVAACTSKVVPPASLSFRHFLQRHPAVLQRAPTKLRATLAEEDVDSEEGLADKPDERVPVTVITGFLGSGKTTLLNYILSQPHGKRIAVIENEFGVVDIDSDLVAVEQELAGTAEKVITLNNGCLCCTVRDDLIGMLNMLYDQRDKFDQIVIETTGLANPGPVVQSFLLNDSVREKMRLDGVVTLVDAKHCELHLDEEKPEGKINETVEQIAMADRILLNKIDLVGEGDLDRVEGRIRAINSLAEIVRTERSVVNVDYVLGMGGYDLTRVEADVEKATKPAHAHDHEHHAHDHECSGADCSHESHSHEHHAHDHECSGADCSHESHSHEHKVAEAAVPKVNTSVHDDQIGSISFVIDGDMDLDKVNYWLGGIVELRGEDIYRMKGVLSIKDFDQRFVFHGVHMIFDGTPDRKWKEGEKRQSKMVFIGRDLDAELFREGFEQCVAKDEAVEVV